MKRSIAERKEAIRKQEADETARWINANEHLRAARRHRIPFDPADIGFEFSTEEIEAREQQRDIKSLISDGRYYEYRRKGYIKAPAKAA